MYNNTDRMAENTPGHLFAAVYDISEVPHGAVHFEVHITKDPSILEQQIKNSAQEIIKSVDLEGVKEIPVATDHYFYLQDLATKYDGLFFPRLHSIMGLQEYLTAPYFVAFYNSKIFKARDLMDKECFEIKKVVKLAKAVPKK